MKTPAPVADVCSDHRCRQRHDPAERLMLAESLCRQRGVTFTQVRRRILQLLLEHSEPMGAYTLMDAIRESGESPLRPPTVYRALDFLIAQGLVLKIGSKNAFIPCSHPERRHACILFICETCGGIVEIENRTIEKQIQKEASSLAFDLDRNHLEISGRCEKCLD